MDIKQRLAEIREQIRALYMEQAKLVLDCQHVIIESHDSAHCDICGKDFGWWCPDSTTHICQYEDDSECCIFCGQPDERK